MKIFINDKRVNPIAYRQIENYLNGPQQGIATLASGTVTIKNPNVYASWLGHATYIGPPSSPGFLHLVFSNGSFTINSSSGSDASKVSYRVWGPDSPNAS